MRVLALFVAGLLCIGVPVGTVDLSTLPLLQKTDLTYRGAFRLPTGADRASFSSGGKVIAVTTKHTLLALNHLKYQEVSEMSIPDPRVAPALSGLLRAEVLQPPTDVLAGHRNDGFKPSQIGGLLPWQDGRLIVTTFVYYDAKAAAKLSHFKTALDFANLGTVAGPVQVGNGQAGFVGGYMTPIPAEWQTALGGPALTGQCCLSITNRTSSGPSASVFDPSQVGSVSPVPATRVLAYPLDHQTLGGCSGNGNWKCGSVVGGVFFPSGTRSVLFVGTLGTGAACYGEGTAKKELAGTHKNASKTLYCYDPSNGNKGYHAFPYTAHVWAYDAQGFVDVKNGRKQPWELRPYTTWNFTLPFQTAGARVFSVAFDAETKNLYLSAQSTDSGSPLIHVFAVK